MSQDPTPPPASPEAGLRSRLGSELVDELLHAADEAGRLYLPLDEDPVFGFLQRVLARLRNAGRGQGLVFPKRDPDYNKFFDYFDGEGRIFVVYPVDLAPEEAEPADPTRFGLRPAWVERGPDALAIAPDAPRAIVLEFLRAYDALRTAAAPPAWSARGEGAATDP